MNLLDSRLSAETEIFIGFMFAFALLLGIVTVDTFYLDKPSPNQSKNISEPDKPSDNSSTNLTNQTESCVQVQNQTCIRLNGSENSSE